MSQRTRNLKRVIRFQVSGLKFHVNTKIDVTENQKPETRNSKPGTILAFDFGEKRIGAAVGETAIGIAHPLTTINAADKQRRYAAIGELVQEWRPSRLVVGLPAHLDGVEHELSRLARKFARELGARFGLPVELIDERLTSAAAESSLAEAGVAPRKRKPLIDRVAAQHILQAYLNATASNDHARPA